MNFIERLKSHLVSSSREGDSVSTLASETKSLLDQGRFNDACLVALTALNRHGKRLNPEFVDYFVTIVGRASLHSGEYAAGLAFFDGHLRRYPNNVLAHEMAAGLLWCSGQLDKAL